MREQLFLDHIATPIGELALIADVDGGFALSRMEPRPQAYAATSLRVAKLRADPRFCPAGLGAALRAYFGDLTAIDGLPVVMNGTDFERMVWRALRDIPCGETCSYGEIARRIGRPAVRAVGLANGRIRSASSFRVIGSLVRTAD